MNRRELNDAVAAKAGITKSAAALALNVTFVTIAETLKAGGEVHLPGFGTFTVHDAPARTGRNPATGEPIQIPASKKAKFKPSRQLLGAPTS